MLIGLALFAGFSAACALAQSIGQLMAFRVLQGVSASVEAVVGLAIVRDLFNDTDQVRALALWGMAIAIAPAVAPIIGGYVHITWGWQANFWILATCGAAISLLIWRFLPESSTQGPHALRPRVIARNYAALISNRRFMSYVVMLGTSLGSIFAFITAGPFILIEQFGVLTHHYGYYQAAIVAAFFLGSLVSNALAHRVRLERMLQRGLGLAALGALAAPLIYLAGHLTPLSLTLAMALSGAGMGPIFAVAPSFALRHAAHRVGAAAALIGAGEMITSGLACGLVTILHDGTAKPLVVTLSVLLAVAAAAWFAGRPGDQPGPPPKNDPEPRPKTAVDPTPRGKFTSSPSARH